jgi:hypothetical protein
MTVLQQVQANMILQNFSHQTVHAASHRRKLHLRKIMPFLSQFSLYGFHLSANAFHGVPLSRDRGRALPHRLHLVRCCRKRYGTRRRTRINSACLSPAVMEDRLTLFEPYSLGTSRLALWMT